MASTVSPVPEITQMRFRFSLYLATVLASAPAALTAQLPVPLVLGGHLGAALPAGDIGESSSGFSAGTGPSFGGFVRVEPFPVFGVFAVYEQAHFSCDDCDILGLDDTLVLKAVGGGVRLVMPIGFARFSPWLEGALIRQTIGFSGDGVDFTSEAALGFTAGAGVTLPLVPRVELSPRIRYLSAPAEFDFSSLPDREVDASAIKLDLGLGIRL
jgi:hypothetical protein